MEYQREFDHETPEAALWAAVLGTFIYDAGRLRALRERGIKIKTRKEVLLAMAAASSTVGICEALGIEHAYFYRKLEDEFK